MLVSDITLLMFLVPDLDRWPLSRWFRWRW